MPDPAEYTGPVIPSKAPAEYTGAVVPMKMTPEQRYEGLVNRLPKAAQYVAPGTMGEAGFMAGSLPLAYASLVGVPETGGLSLLGTLPFIGAAAGGYLEDPKNRLANAAYETGKGVLQDVGGRLAGKGVELGARFLGKSALLDKSAARIAGAVTGLFSKYPLPNAPKTAEELEDHLGGGKVTEAAGKRLGDFRDSLTKQLGKYQPAVKPQLVPASPGVPYHYTAGSPAKGQAFVLPDLDANGNRITRAMGIDEAIDHVREMLAGGRTATGMQKATAAAPKVLDTAIDARNALTQQLNKLRPGLGDQYAAYSKDYGTARQLQKVFAGSGRSTRIGGQPVGVIDQPKVLDRTNKVASKLEAIRSGSGTKLRTGVAPTGGVAIPEQGPGIRTHVGESGLRSLFHPPVPFTPETRAMLPRLVQILSDPRMAPILSSLGLSSAQAATGSK